MDYFLYIIYLRHLFPIHTYTVYIIVSFYKPDIDIAMTDFM